MSAPTTPHIARGESSHLTLTAKGVCSPTRKRTTSNKSYEPGSPAPGKAAPAPAGPTPMAMAEYETDVPYGDLRFTKKGVKGTYWNGMPSCAGGPISCCIQCGRFCQLASSMEMHDVVILDARKRELEYENTGFTLRPLKTKVADWSQIAVDGSEQQQIFKAELEKEIRALHPKVERIEFMQFLRRGGGTNPPATNGLHLDIYPDLEVVDAFKYGSSGPPPSKGDDDGLKLGLILGLWMPRDMPNAVHDYPFFFGDMSTFEFSDVVPQKQDFKQMAAGKSVRMLNVAANPPIFSPAQRWYYYNQQTTEELVIFRHLTNPAGGKACFHAAFAQPLPEGMQTRQSVEARAMLYFKPEDIDAVHN